MSTLVKVSPIYNSFTEAGEQSRIINRVTGHTSVVKRIGRHWCVCATPAVKLAMTPINH